MGLFDKMKEPVFLKESSDAERQLEKLKSLEHLLNLDGKAKLMQDIKFLECGIAGEKNIAFELKNSHIPMYITHDVYLEDGDLSSQIDYLVFTRKLCFVIECKNLIGNIEITNTGDFIRTMEFYGKKKKEGIYSPLTQNQRHLELLKMIKMDNRNNVITKFMAGKYFESFHKSIVVLANPKTIMNTKFAKKEIKNQVIKADQLVNYIKDACKNSKESERSDSELLSWAQSYLNFHKDVEKDYTAKYEPYMIKKSCIELTKPIGNMYSDVKNNEITLTSDSDSDSNASIEENAQENMKEIITERTEVSTENKNEVSFEKTTQNVIIENIEETALFKELKSYRWNKSSAEKIKPYFIYNDNQLKDLISKMPSTLDELKKVSGFADGKIAKYGNDIIKIVQKHI